MKIAIVTGASGNLGQAVIRRFLEDGYHVTGTIIPNDPVKLTINHNNFETTIVDLMNEQSSSEFISTVIEKHSRIDVAVLTVGGFQMGKIGDTPISAITKQIRLNFETAYNVARPVFNQMLK